MDSPYGAPGGLLGTDDGDEHQFGEHLSSLADATSPAAEPHHVHDQFHHSMYPSSHIGMYGMYQDSFYGNSHMDAGALCHPPLMHAPYDHGADMGAAVRLSPISMDSRSPTLSRGSSTRHSPLMLGSRSRLASHQLHPLQPEHPLHHISHNALHFADDDRIYQHAAAEARRIHHQQLEHVEQRHPASSQRHPQISASDLSYETANNARLRMMRAAAAAIIESPMGFDYDDKEALQRQLNAETPEAQSKSARTKSSGESRRASGSDKTDPSSPTAALAHPDNNKADMMTTPAERKTSARRAEQNRTAQRAFRERRQQYVKELEAKAAQSDSLEVRLAEADARLAEVQCLAERLVVDREAWVSERELWWRERDEAVSLANSLVQELDTLSKENVKFREVLDGLSDPAIAAKIAASLDTPSEGSRKRSALSFEDMIANNETPSKRQKVAETAEINSEEAAEVQDVPSTPGLPEEDSVVTDEAPAPLMLPTRRACSHYTPADAEPGGVDRQTTIERETGTEAFAKVFGRPQTSFL
ncbi:uncharacterized protein EV422DRAFT_566163 [Fimicolochytrium jonesii]|uniref:uncharacterized protein n=1 Tax=Fimicolochytrium jonesii TaxID=1396493 RepID=UPI0022FE16AF|nr:uncharacterized protein EV422DRAFT_566163 [Fimicolochytrium jonesii]KAI8822474.1 hypothetical protein EV422DRAFT_566163 [Fimicolochytrium jonesii]